MTGLIVALVSLVAYAIHSRAHYDSLDEVVATAAEHVAEQYAAASTPQERAAVVLFPIAPSLAVRVYGTHGQILEASPNSTLAPLVDPTALLASLSAPAYDPLVGLAPRLMSAHGEQLHFAVARDTAGDRWRLYALPGSGFTVVAAAPLADVDRSVAALGHLLPFMVVGGALVAFVSAGLIAGRALQPVATLTSMAGVIASSRAFDRRVPVGARRDELTTLAETFNAMLGSLEAAYRAQLRFVADASHELRAPLTAIQANLELLERQPGMPEAERADALSEAGREARRLTHLVADLLALARADAGTALRRDRVELDRVLLDTLAEARHLARPGQRLEVDELEPTVLEADADRLKQVLLVLLDNALKYTPGRGAITLALRRSGGAAQLTVRDTGVGIPPEDLPRVFERFYRADPARARDPGGTGLGLPIARWIVEQHGGSITLESTPGQGTLATVRLPLKRA
ncbi:MAG: HAMP domain-containing histidine kinase [Chloroflexi bacterium]|nr:HAMP domain-containing histidine kinase [Chloroflexota bacterium]